MTMGERTTSLRPAGWYTDPEDATRLRKWDGRGWTDSWMKAPGATSAGQRAGAGVFSAGTTSPGWYNDPGTGRSSRFWDGGRWTDRVRPGLVHRPRPALGDGFFALAAVLRVLLVAAGVVGGLSGLGSVWSAQVLSRWSEDLSTATEAEGARIDMLTLVSGLAWSVTVIATGVLFIVWLFRAYGSDRVDPARLTHGRGWTVGAWFTPVLGAWRPRRLVLDLWAGARSGTPAQEHDSLGWRLDVWWGGYLLMNVLGYVSTRLALDVDDADGPEALVDALLTSAVVDVVWALVTVVASWFAYVVVREVTAALRRPESLEPLPETAPTV